VKRDHDAEWKRWTGWLEHISQRVSAIAGVATNINQPNGLSNKTPSLTILWDRQKIGTTGDAVARVLLDGDPRITLDAVRGGPQGNQTGVRVTPYMLASGEEKIIADRLVAVLSKPPAPTDSNPPAAATTDVTGQWNVKIQYAAATSSHTLHLTQKGNELGGFHQGEFITREITGTIDGESVRIRSAYGEQHGDSVSLTFVGKVNGDQMSGPLDMGEYLAATWMATRRTGGRRG